MLYNQYFLKEWTDNYVTDSVNGVRLAADNHPPESAALQSFVEFQLIQPTSVFDLILLFSLHTAIFIEIGLKQDSDYWVNIKKHLICKNPNIRSLT